MTDTPGWIAALLAALITVGGGAVAGSIGHTNLQVQQTARAAAESIAQNGCYTSGTEALIGAALQKAGMDPAKVAMSASTTKQGYGQAVDVRMEYVREFEVLGLQTPWVWRAAATAPEVSTNVVPIQNVPCKTPAFAAATGRSGLESAGSGLTGGAGAAQPNRQFSDGQRFGAYVYDGAGGCWRSRPEPGKVYAAVMPPGQVCRASNQ